MYTCTKPLGYTTAINATLEINYTPTKIFLKRNTEIFTHHKIKCHKIVFRKVFIGWFSFASRHKEIITLKKNHRNVTTRWRVISADTLGLFSRTM